jgi:hypothetical protein
VGRAIPRATAPPVSPAAGEQRHIHRLLSVLLSGDRLHLLHFLVRRWPYWRRGDTASDESIRAQR